MLNPPTQNAENEENKTTRKIVKLIIMSSRGARLLLSQILLVGLDDHSRTPRPFGMAGHRQESGARFLEEIGPVARASTLCATVLN